MSSEDDGAAGAPGAGGPAGGQPIMKEVSWGRVRHQLPSHYYTPSRPYLDFFEQLSQPGAGRSAVHFKSSVGLGRVGLMTFGMGLVAGFHLLLIGISYYFGSAAMLQWGLYVVALMAFHLMEFVTTARWNPRTTTADCECLCVCVCSGSRWEGRPCRFASFIVRSHLRPTRPVVPTTMLQQAAFRICVFYLPLFPLTHAKRPATLPPLPAAQRSCSTTASSTWRPSEQAWSSSGSSIS